MNLKHFFSRCAVVFFAFQLSACATIIASTSGPTPLDSDRGSRTFGAFIEDESIEIKVKANLFKADQGFRDGHISVVSFNGITLITGQIKSEALKQRASDIAKQVRHVRKVHNELTVAGPISYLSRSNDTWLTNKVKTRMYFTADFPASRTKVVTEAGAIYLMGLLTNEEAQKAVNIARQVYGVQKIVKIIEYIN